MLSQRDETTVQRRGQLLVDRDRLTAIGADDRDRDIGAAIATGCVSETHLVFPVARNSGAKAGGLFTLLFTLVVPVTGADITLGELGCHPGPGGHRLEIVNNDTGQLRYRQRGQALVVRGALECLDPGLQ